MAQKGSVNTNVDFEAINAVILAAGKYQSRAEDITNEIRKICEQMKNDETLVGNNGDIIRECFASIGKGAQDVQESLHKLVNITDKALGRALKAAQTQHTAEAEEAATAAAKNTGVYGKE